MATNSFNDRVANALEGYPMRNNTMRTLGGTSAGTVTVPTGGAVHTVYLYASGGDCSITFPNGGGVVTVKSGQTFQADFKGFMDGGNYVIAGTNPHYLIAYVPNPSA
jgi:hypothetical protein